MGYVLARDEARSIALHDCDILTYDRELLARLVYPVANPLFNYEFCKGYYPRIANNKMNAFHSLNISMTNRVKMVCIINDVMFKRNSKNAG